MRWPFDNTPTYTQPVKDTTMQRVEVFENRGQFFRTKQEAARNELKHRISEIMSSNSDYLYSRYGYTNEDVTRKAAEIADAYNVYERMLNESSS